MKKRNTTIFAFLLLAAVGMGVGYAALTQEMGVHGDVVLKNDQAQDEFTESIVFQENPAIVSSNAKAGADVIVLDGTKHNATWTINSLAAKDDTTKATFTILNKGDVDAYIKSVTIPGIGETAKADGQDSVYSITVTGLTAGQPTTPTLEALEGTVSFSVEVKMLVDPTDNKTYSFDIGFVAETCPNMA